MPNRIIKESICSSDSVDQLSWFEEVVFCRLIVNCDDYGRFDGRLAIIKSRLFPLKNDLREKDIKEALDKLELVGTVQRYTVDQKPYLQLQAWPSHQTVRNKKSKYPGPELADKIDTCMQMNADECKCLRNPIQSNPNPIQIQSENKLGAKNAPSRQPAIEFLINDNTLYPIYQDKVDEWIETYPAVNVLQELKEMGQWLKANPKRRKTKSGILRFITTWLGKEQDKPHPRTTNNKPVANSTDYAHDSDFLQDFEEASL